MLWQRASSTWPWDSALSRDRASSASAWRRRRPWWRWARVTGWRPRRAVWLRELRTETFALVDPRDGPGFNRAVIAPSSKPASSAHTVPDPRGPMAWETAVRLDGHVGVTARSAAVSSARNLRLIELRDEFTFPLQFVRPALPLAALRPVARAFRALGRELAARGF